MIYAYYLLCNHVYVLYVTRVWLHHVYEYIYIYNIHTFMMSHVYVSVSFTIYHSVFPKKKQWHFPKWMVKIMVETLWKNGWFRKQPYPLCEAEVTKLKPRIAKVSLDPRKKGAMKETMVASMEGRNVYIYMCIHIVYIYILYISIHI